MSNIIPIVSSSPPPYEDSQSCGWDDEDDDDFGNFASAPTFQESATDLHDGDAGFDVDWSHAGGDTSPSNSDSKSGSPVKEVVPPSSHQSRGNSLLENKTHSSPPPENINKTACFENGNEGSDDEFKDFKSFQDTKHSKPNIGSLPLQSTNPDAAQTDLHTNANGSTGSQTAVERSRESTTDSGLFSSDLSPVPKSDSTSECDKVLHSEDETFSDLPQDNHGDELSPLEGSGKSDTIEEEDASESVDELCEETELGGPSCEQECDNLHSMHDESAQNCGESSGIEGAVTEASTLSDKGGSDEIHVSSDQSGEQVSSEPQAEKPNSTEKTEEKEEAVPNNDAQSDNGWAAFETFDENNQPSEGGAGRSGSPEPEDLVLRVPSVDVEQDEDEQDNFGDFSAGVTNSRGDSGEGDSYTDTVDTEPEISDSSAEGRLDEKLGGEAPSQSELTTSACETENTSGKVSQEGKEEPSDTTSHTPDAIDMRKEEDGPSVGASNEEDDDFGDFSGQPAGVSSSELGREEPESGSASETVDTPAAASSHHTAEDEEDDFGDFSGQSATSSNEKSATGDSTALSSEEPAGSTEDLDDDDFGDFRAQTPVQPSAAHSSSSDDFGAFSGNAVSSSNAGDDFGDFSGQNATSDSAGGDSGWAAFGNNPVSETADDEDFGDFSEQKMEPLQTKPSSSVPASQQYTQVVQGSKLEKALSTCFPELTLLPAGGTNQKSTSEEESDRKNVLGTLGTILKYGLGYRTASQQTWEVVEHPSKRDPRVKLWHHLEDVDGSPAVVYQWMKSSCNSQLFKTLHIDTQNMLIGHKKPSVPIFATGLSLLEPIRGGSRDRGDRAQPMKETPPSLVDPNQHEPERHAQDIPAVDFDWSSSGLTNPLTSKSLDLDFLVVQENDSSEKLSDEWDWVFESELLDAPRSNVKLVQPLEELLKNVKPTSVRNRRDDLVASQMSEEALRILAGLPDLSFMQSKVLMFPIKN